MPTDGIAKSGLSWTSYPSAAYYIIYRSLSRDEGYVAIGTTAETTYLDQSAGLTNGTTYFYQVSAVVNGSETTHSWEQVARPLDPPLPVRSASAKVACHGVRLTWQPPANASVSPPLQYLVHRAVTNSSITNTLPGHSRDKYARLL